MPLIEQEGDLLTTDAQYIVQQCNCITTRSQGLSKLIFSKYPYADIYTERKRTGTKDTPSTIIIRGNGVNERFIINMLGQYYPGKGGRYSNDDSFQMREQWFQSCLNQISQISDITSIAFPYRIGCGLAGGNWKHYHLMITEFSSNNPNINVFILKLLG